MKTRCDLTVAPERAVERRDLFSLIEVMLPRGERSDTLARFLAGLKAHRARKDPVKARTTSP